MRTSKIFLTVDILLFKDTEKPQKILLIKRKNNPFKDYWAIPGGFVEENEDLETAAIRELFEETQIKVDQLEQLYAFGKPFRDPRNHVVSIAFVGFVEKNTTANAADDALKAAWFSINDLPEMAFDHLEIITFALSKKTYEI